MTTPTSTLSCLAALLIMTVPLVAAPAPAAAQPAPPAPPATAVSTQSQIQAATEQRISGLQTQLAITAAQMPQWNAFAQVMRDNAQSTDALFRQRAAGVQSMNAVANMQSYAQISRAYADGAEKLAASLGTLYGILSDPQKQAVDTLFQQQAANAAKPQAKAR
jgi:protein CpxP